MLLEPLLPARARANVAKRVDFAEADARDRIGPARA
jgi:hypothetical protein